MAQGKKSFILYSNWRDTFEALEDSQCAELIRHIFKYVNDENPILEDKSLLPVWLMMKPILKLDLEKWDKQRKQRSEAGKKSAESRKRKSTSVNENERKSTVNVNDNVNVDSNTIYNSEIDFLKDWKKARKKLIGKPTNINKLNISERRDFEVLRNEFSIEDFRKGMVGLFSQKGMFESSQLRPSHFLRDRNIEKYIDCKTNDIQLFKEEKQVKL